MRYTDGNADMYIRTMLKNDIVSMLSKRGLSKNTFMMCPAVMVMAVSKVGYKYNKEIEAWINKKAVNSHNYYGIKHETIADVKMILRLLELKGNIKNVYRCKECFYKLSHNERRLINKWWNKIDIKMLAKKYDITTEDMLLIIKRTLFKADKHMKGIGMSFRDCYKMSEYFLMEG